MEVRLDFSMLGSERKLVTQSCPTLCDPMDCSPPGSSVLGILQARVLEWVASARKGSQLNICQIEFTCL